MKNHFFEEVNSQFRTTCPTCKRHFTGIENRRFIDEIGECMNCDHVRGEVVTQEKDENLED